MVRDSDLKQPPSSSSLGKFSSGLIRSRTNYPPAPHISVGFSSLICASTGRSACALAYCDVLYYIIIDNVLCSLYTFFAPGTRYNLVVLYCDIHSTYT